MRYNRSYAQWIAYLKDRGAQDITPGPDVVTRVRRRHPDGTLFETWMDGGKRDDLFEPLDLTAHDRFAVIWTSQYWQGATEKEKYENYLRIVETKDYDLTFPSRFNDLVDGIRIREELERDGWDTGGVALGFAYYQIEAHRPKIAPRPAGQCGLEVFA
ncbi:MAG: hypothetical protein WC277_08000 [Bacilli bacterium]